MMRAVILAAGAMLALSGCNKSGSDQANADMNVASANDNMTTDPNMMMDENAAMMNAPGGMDGNTATNAATENLMKKDLNTHDPDTNLANGI